MARAHPAGCRLAERAARSRAERLPQHFPFTHRTPRGDCPVGATGLGSGARRAAAAAAAAAIEGRAMRPVVVGYGARLGQVRYMCGSATARRTVVVDITLTALLPSASLSERDLAVARIGHHGWRVWALLH